MAFKRSAVRSRLSPPTTARHLLCGVFLHLKKQYMHTEKTLNEKMIDLQLEIPYSYCKEGLPCPKMSMKS